jgi:hypothetical protein
MKQLSIYRILTYLLVPFAAFFGLIDLLIILSALANPALLLAGFIFTAFVIYTFVSLKFLNRGLQYNQPCKPQLRDWIKVNAYVSTFMAIMFLLNSLSVYFSSEVMLRQMMEEYLEKQPSISAQISPEFMLKMLKFMAACMLILGAVLIVHIQITFRLLKQYAFLFEPQPPAES